MTTATSSRCQRSVRLLVILMAMAALVPSLLVASRSASAQEVPSLQINSKRYVVTDADTGQIYAQRNPDEEVAIGSLTKIYTGVEALEIAPLDTVITVTDDDMLDPSTNSLMGIEPGQQLTLRELLYGMFLPSGNDAAHAVARSLGHRDGDTSAQQSIDRYMGWVNQRVADMGLTHTHLITPDGWGVKGHYTTAHDLAAFTRYAMEYPFFSTLISTQTYTTSYGAVLTNNNRLLGEYQYLLGGKTGYDWDAGWCLVEVAQKDGMTMISVTLDGIHDNQDWYNDNEVLLDYGFEQRTITKSDNTKWTGSSAAFVDPDIAMLARSSTSDVAIGGISVPVISSKPPGGNGQVAQAGSSGQVPSAGASRGAMANGNASQQAVAATGDNQGDGRSFTRGPLLARILLMIGIVGLIVLAAAFVYSKLNPRRSISSMVPTVGPSRQPTPAAAPTPRMASRGTPKTPSTPPSTTKARPVKAEAARTRPSPPIPARSGGSAAARAAQRARRSTE